MRTCQMRIKRRSIPPKLIEHQKVGIIRGAQQIIAQAAVFCPDQRNIRTHDVPQCFALAWKSRDMCRNITRLHRFIIHSGFCQYFNVSIHSRPIRRLASPGQGAQVHPSRKGKTAKKDFIGFALLSGTLFPLKRELSNHKGIFDENH